MRRVREHSQTLKKCRSVSRRVAVCCLTIAVSLAAAFLAYADEYGPGMSDRSGGWPGGNKPWYNGGDNNPAYHTGWDAGVGPGYEGSNPLGDRQSYEDQIYAGGPGSEEARRLLDEEENSFYVHSTYRGGTWEQQADGRWKLLKENGQPVSSEWAYVDGKTYLLDMYGIMQTGFQRVNGNRYYFNSLGAMQTGWLLKEGRYYFLNTDGSMAYGWGNTMGDWYYLDIATGVMQTNTYTPDGRYVNAEGILIQ